MSTKKIFTSIFYEFWLLQYVDDGEPD